MLSDHALQPGPNVNRFDPLIDFGQTPLEIRFGFCELILKFGDFVCLNHLSMSLSRSASLLSRPLCPRKRGAPCLEDVEDRRPEQSPRQLRWQAREADLPQSRVSVRVAGQALPALCRTVKVFPVAFVHEGKRRRT